MNRYKDRDDFTGWASRIKEGWSTDRLNICRLHRQKDRQTYVYEHFKQTVCLYR